MRGVTILVIERCHRRRSGVIRSTPDLVKGVHGNNIEPRSRLLEHLGQALVLDQRDGELEQSAESKLLVTRSGYRRVLQIFLHMHVYLKTPWLYQLLVL